MISFFLIENDILLKEGEKIQKKRIWNPQKKRRKLIEQEENDPINYLR